MDWRKLGDNKTQLDAGLSYVFRFVESAKSWLVGIGHGTRKRYMP